MYLRHRLDKLDPQIHVYQNVFRGLLTALAFGGSEPETRDTVFVYRNLFDLCSRVPTGRPSPGAPRPSFSTGKLMGDHGSPPWPAMNIYQNTIVALEPARDVEMAAAAGASQTRPRRVMNNLFIHAGPLPGFVPPSAAANCASDGNLYWSPVSPDVTAESLLGRFRASEQFAASKQLYPAGSASNSLVANPRFVRFVVDLAADNDYRLSEGSPAANAGVPLPAEWPDPLRAADRDRPDIGALPLGAQPHSVGRAAAQ
jgi:hypothetical protein